MTKMNKHDLINTKTGVIGKLHNMSLSIYEVLTQIRVADSLSSRNVSNTKLSVEASDKHETAAIKNKIKVTEIASVQIIETGLTRDIYLDPSFNRANADNAVVEALEEIKKESIHHFSSLVSMFNKENIGHIIAKNSVLTYVIEDIKAGKIIDVDGYSSQVPVDEQNLLSDITVIANTHNAILTIVEMAKQEVEGKSK